VASTERGKEARRAWERWWQLGVGVVCMCMIANLQYGWTLFVNPIHDRHGWSKASIQVAFTLFVLFETWLVPVEGYLVDRFGPRPVAIAGGALCGVAWTLNARAGSLAALYFAAIIGGVGAGAVYGTCVGNALRWFADRRGLAAGLTAAGFGAGSALTVAPIAAMIRARGYEATFLFFGLVQGAVVVVLALMLRAPDPTPMDSAAGVSPHVAQFPARQYAPLDMARTLPFWVLYAMFVMMASGGLMATAQLGPMAKDYKVSEVPVTLLGLTLPALTFALSIDRVFNGLTRPFFGAVSDRIGRENSMFIGFALEGLGVILLGRFAQDPKSFVVLSGLVFFAWGEIYSLFPATCCDMFGTKHAAANAGLLYTAKGAAALLVPVGSVLAARGGWQQVFVVASVLNFIAAALALLVLKPLRQRAGRRVVVEPQPVRQA
jgi:MFS transporter, OFA family, oxalate/formate antiporter